jgi:hypothetical protein
MTRKITTGYACSLLGLSFLLMLLLLATGHQISLEDNSQIKLIVEAVIFSLTGITILKRKPSSYIIAITLLILTQLSLVDIYTELSQDEINFVIAVLLLILSGLTLYEIFKCIKASKIF